MNDPVTTADPSTADGTATATSDTTSVVTPTSEPAQTETSQQPPSADAAHAATPSTGPSTTTTPPAGSGSLADRNRSNTTTPPDAAMAGAKAQVDWEKRYHDQMGYMTRLAQERADYQKQLQAWDGLDPRQVRDQMQRQQAEAQRLNLRPWHPNHPEVAKTEARLSRVDAFRASRDAILGDPGLDPEAKQRLVGRLAQEQGVGEEDVKLWREHQETVREAQVRLARDPEGFIQQIALPLAQQIADQALQKYDQYRTVSVQTEQWLGSHKDALDKFGNDVLWAMDQNTPRRDVGLTIAQLKSQVESLRAQLGQSKETVESAAAQQAALKTKATMTRDARTSAPATDPVEEGLAQGLSGQALIEHLRNKRRDQLSHT